MKPEVIEHEPTVPTTAPDTGKSVTVMTPMDMIERAVTSGAEINVIEKLMALQERWEANQARKAFNEAIAAAKAEIPRISKNRVVDFTSPKGRTHYRHEDMGEIAKTVDPILGKYGLSYRYRASSNVNEPVSVTCIVSHRAGHSEETTLTAGRDETGNKNSIQAVGSTITFLQRYSLKVALGLAASNDDDGKAAGDDAGFISADQVKEIESLMAETGTAPQRFCGYMKIERIEEIPAKQFRRAIDALNAKKTKS